MTRLLFAATLLLVTACTSETVRVYNVDAPSAVSPWLGRAEKEVIALCGPPSRREPDGEGGEILIYETVTPANAASDVVAPPALPSSDATGDEKARDPAAPLTRFWLRPSGMVYRAEMGTRTCTPSSQLEGP